ncbi:riboflavin synthase [Candidatus Woesearchaeota archaeon]|nr:riboflavin synthase [Candidatus Woesearchaeota archaeon]
MFSGIVEGLRKVVKINSKKDFSTILVDLGVFSKGEKIGDSISVNGACLTIAKLEGSLASFDIIKETLDKTDLGDLKKNDKVNIERSLKIGERLDGHFVLGHVDGIGIIEKKIQDEDNCVIWISLPKNLEYGLIPKGSIGVEGISLTIADIKENKFAIALIPHTLKITTLGIKEKGDKVNIEIDYLGKWIKKIVEEKE